MANTMTWEQKLEALNSLAEHSLKMREPGDWFVCTTTNIADNGVLIGSYGNGKYPEEAVLNHWEKYICLKPHQYIVARRGSDTIYVKWNGFMWKDVSYMRKT